MKQNCKIKSLLWMGIIAGSLLPANLLVAQTAGELLPKAIQLEEVKGELEQAIDIYLTITEDFPDNKPVAAEAYFRMGTCYEKLGKEEAMHAYRKLIQDYPDQQDLVSRARQRLSALNRTPDLAENRELMVRKVWSDSDVDIEGEISPDGRYISYVDWDTGNLAVYETGSGKKRPVTSEGSWEDPNQFSEYSRWSPDGQKLVYCWYNDYNPSWVDLYITGLDGSGRKKLWSDSLMNWTQCYDWSPDGRYILVCCLKKDNTMHIGLVSVADGSLRFIKELTGGQEWTPWPTNMGFSPDSRFIAYDFPMSPENPARNISLLSIDGKTEVPVVDHPADDYLLGWSPENQEILFASNRNGTLSAWLTHWDGGTGFKDPVLVKQDIGNVVPIGFTQNGSYYYAIQQRMQDVYTVDIDAETGKAVAPVEKSIRQFEGYNEAPAYSPDGKSMAYISIRSPWIKPLGAGIRGGNVLCIKSLETGEVRELNPDLGRMDYPRWSADGSSIAVVNWRLNAKAEICSIDVQTGQVSLISRPDNDHTQFGGHGWLNSAETCYYGLADLQTGDWNIASKNLENGTETTIYRSGDFYTFTLSPDGQWFALICPSFDDAKISIVSKDGKESKILCRFKEGTELGRVPCHAWSADGKYIYFNMRESQPDPDATTPDPISAGKFELCRIPVTGGEVEKLGLKINGLFLNMSMHPSGNRIAFSMEDQFVSEIWVMDNIF